MKLNRYGISVISLLTVVGVFWFLAARPPVLKIIPKETSFGLNKAIIKCEIKNNSLFPVNVLRPFFSQTFWFRVVGPDGKEIESGLIEDRGWYATDIIPIKPNSEYGFEIDLRKYVYADTKFPELPNKASKELKEEYKKHVLQSQSVRLYDIAVPGKYKVQAYYYIARDFKSMHGKQIWTGKIKSNTIEVLFEDKSGIVNKD